MRTPLLRRLAVPLGGAALIVGFGYGGIGPAQANAAPSADVAGATIQSTDAARACQIKAKVSRVGNTVSASRFILCAPDPEPRPLPVKLIQTNPSTGVSVVVASDDGTDGVATYVCTGSLTRKYTSSPASNSLTTGCS